MKNPAITLANETHRDKAAVRLSFEKGFMVVDKVKSNEGDGWRQRWRFWYIRHGGFKHSFAAYNPEQRIDIQEHTSLKATGSDTHNASNALAKIKSPLDHFLLTDKENFVFANPLLPFGTGRKPFTHCTHLQIAQANARIKICKRVQFLPSL